MIIVNTQTEFDNVVNSSPSGEKIIIRKTEDGKAYTLTKPWVVSSNTTIVGEKLPEIEYKGTYNESAHTGLIRVAGTASALVEQVTIRGLKLTFKGTSSSLFHGIFTEYVGKTPAYNSTGYSSSIIGISNANNVGVKIDSCVIDGFRVGIYLGTSSNMSVITDNIVRNSTSHGIYLHSACDRNIIKSNKVVSNTGKGMYIVSSRNNIISSNVVDGNGVSGIEMNDSHVNIIDGNISQNNKQRGIYTLISSKNAISANTIQGNAAQGIFLYRSTDNTVTGNTVTKNSNVGIYLESTARGNTITSNIVQDNRDYGIAIASSTGNVVNGNLVQGNSYGIYTYATSGSTMMYSNTTIDNVNGNSFGGTSDDTSVAYNQFL